MKYFPLIMLLISFTAFAIEGGVSLYPPGYLSPQAGIAPSPGSYVGLEFYSYSGDAEKHTRAGRLYFDSDLEISADIFTYTYAAQAKVWNNGTPFFSVMLPYTNIEMDGEVTGTFPNLGLVERHRFEKSTGSLGDTSITAGVGWHRDYFHYMFLTNVYAPTGDYDKNKFLNVGLNRWGIQPMAAFTYLNEKNGIEVSSALGYMVNLENTETKYNSGDELNAELAVIQHFSKAVNLGLIGYANQQVTGDSGEGAILGEFKGQVYGAGLTLGGQAAITEEHDFLFNFRYYNEFNAIHRFEGQSFYVSGTVDF